MIGNTYKNELSVPSALVKADAKLKKCLCFVVLSHFDSFLHLPDEVRESNFSAGMHPQIPRYFDKTYSVPTPPQSQRIKTGHSVK